jgi:hypothetical protein
LSKSNISGLISHYLRANLVAQWPITKTGLSIEIKVQKGKTKESSDKKVIRRYTQHN